MRKTFSALLLMLVAAAPMFGLAAPTAHAATINTAIRGESALTVYWYANDGKRYTFPNANTYFTWFNSFDSVTNLTDAELANIPLGNQNVTYRPGVKLVKIVSDNKVYAVSKGGILRHVTSESLAIQLYGQLWNLNVHDVPVEFFTNYQVGSPIYSVSDYSVGNEFSGVTYPSDSFRNYTNGTQSGTLSLLTSRTSVTNNQSVQLDASYNATIPTGGRIEIKEVRTNNIVKTCYNAQTCTATTFPYNTSYASTQYVATVFNGSGVQLATQTGATIFFDGMQTGTVTVTVDRTTVSLNEPILITATYSGNLPTDGYIRFYGPNHIYSNNIWAYCLNQNPCQKTVSIDADTYNWNFGQVNQATFKFTAKVENGSTILATNDSPLITVNNTQTGTYQNDGENYINGLTLQADRTNINRGDSVTLTANAFNVGNWSYIGNRIEIRDIRNNFNVVKTCTDQSWCAVTLPVNGTDGIAQYEARIWDRLNRLVMSQNGPVIYVSGTGSTGSTGTTGSASVTLESNRSSINSGESVILTARSWNAPSDSRLEIYDNRTASLVGSCSSVTSCPITVTVTRRNSEETNAQFYAVLKNVSGNEITRQFGPVIYFTGTGSTGGTDTTGNTLTGTTDIYVSPSSNLRPNATVYVTASIYNPSTAVQNMVIRVYTESNGLLGTCNGVTVCSLPYAIGPSGVNTRTYAQFSATDRSNTIETGRINLIAN